MASKTFNTTLYIWAIPARGEGEDWEYELYPFEDSHWRKGAVMVKSHSVDVEVPEVCVEELAVAKLEKDLEVLRDNYVVNKCKIEEQIARLQRLSYVPNRD